MSTQTPPETKISILTATAEDVPLLAKISASSFEEDRHTQLKSRLGAQPYDHEKGCLERLPGYLESSRCVLLKALWDGEVVGWCAWGFRGFGEGMVGGLKGEEGGKGDGDDGEEKKGGGGDGDEKEKEAEKEEEKEKEQEQDTNQDPLTALQNLTSQNLTHWMQTLMPDGTRCMYIMTLSVASAFQGKGVGSALLKWGTDVADQENTFIWVHSSEGGVGAYVKAGFRVVGSFEVDLDEFSGGVVRGDEGDGGEGKWGVYGFRYLVYGAWEEEHAVEIL